MKLANRVGMKRTVPWATVAFFPLVSLLVVTVFDGASSIHLSERVASSSVVAFSIAYWWAVLSAIVIAQITWFLVAALRNRALPLWLRIVWLAAMVVVGPIAAPAYWWVHSARIE
jgi:hypothetical protein